MNYFALTALISFFATTLLALWVLTIDLEKPVFRSYALLNLSVSFWALFYFFWQTAGSYQSAFFFLKLLMCGATFMPVFLYHFIADYIGEQERKKLKLAVVYLAGFVFLGIISANLLFNTLRPKMYFPFWPDAGPFMGLFLLFFFSVIVNSMYLLYRDYKRAVGLRRTQSQYLFIGLLVAILAGSPNYYLWYNIPIAPWLNPLFVAYFGFVAYAITKHKLLDIEVIVKKTAVYSIMTAFMTGVFLSTIVIGDYWLRLTVGHSSVWTGITAAFVIALFFQPLRDAIQNIVDRIFFRSRYNYQTIIKRYSGALARPMPDLNRFAHLAPYLLWRSLKLNGAAFMSLDRGSNSYVVRAGVGDNEQALGRSVPVKSALIGDLMKNFKEINLEEINYSLKNDTRLEPEARAHFEQLKEEMERLGTVLIIPAISESEYFNEPTLLATLNLSKKLSDESYSKEDIAFLEMLANQAAVSIEYAFILEELKKNQEQVLKSEKLASLGTAVAGIAHELKNPLTYLLTVAQSMAASWDNPTFKESVVKMFPSEVERMKLIIDGLSDYSKTKDLLIEPVEITAVLERTLAILGYEIKKNNVFVVKKYPAENAPKAVALADKNRIVQVFMNIIANGVQAMSGKGGDLTITVHRQGNEVRVGISDTGAGIPEETLQKIFDPFFTTKAAGTGLGLSITKKIVEEHLGAIYIDSRVGEGSTFTICLPAASN